MVTYQEQDHPYKFRYVELYRIIQGLMQENDKLRERIDLGVESIYEKHFLLANALGKLYRQSPWLGPHPTELNSERFRA